MTLAPHRHRANPRSLVAADSRVGDERPVELWSTATIGAALQDGEIDIWKRIAAAVHRDPYGRTARQVEEVVQSTGPNGVFRAMREVLDRARVELEAEERAELARFMRLSFDRSGLNDREFAVRIGVEPGVLACYLDGRLSPPASLVVRIHRLSERFARAKTRELAGTNQPTREQ